MFFLYRTIFDYVIIEDELFFCASNLLFETGIKEQEINVSEYKGVKTLFPFYQNATLPFDPFAASFYLVTRYEEYQPYIKDEFGRFDARESVAYCNGFLQKPIVNYWAEMIKNAILNCFPDFHFPQKKFLFVPTIDIDNAWAYLHKGVVRSTGGLITSLVHLNFGEFANRIKVFAGINPDPYDSYEFQFRLHQQYNLHPLYFVLFADYGKYDKNPPVLNRNYQLLIKSISDYAELGIHPSFASFESPEKLKKEVDRLSNMVNKEIKNSRQHFLRLAMPITYRNLRNLDIENDYTMGYASQPGFRAGICNSYSFYDLDLEEETKLRIHPFMVMDGTLRQYLKLSPSEAMKTIKPIIDEVKAVNGTFISLWHNESLGTTTRWKGWREVYEDMVKYAAEQQSSLF